MFEMKRPEESEPKPQKVGFSKKDMRTVFLLVLSFVIICAFMAWQRARRAMTQAERERELPPVTTLDPEQEEARIGRAEALETIREMERTDPEMGERFPASAVEPGAPSVGGEPPAGEAAPVEPPPGAEAAPSEGGGADDDLVYAGIGVARAF